MSKVVSVMQPYAFPHLSYFKLINEVDIFVLYDDVSFSKGSWVNRNRLNNGIGFTFPLVKQPLGTPISEMKISWSQFNEKKFFKTLKQLYGRNDSFERIFGIIQEIIAKRHELISLLAIDAIKAFNNYLNIDTNIITSSTINTTQSGNKTSRLIEICDSLEATTYVNSEGGASLYDPADFHKHDIELKIIHAPAGLSIIHECFTRPLEELIEIIHFSKPNYLI